MASASVGSTRSAAAPPTSEVAVPALVTTAVPWAIASRTGMPNPSRRLGYTNTVARS